MTIGLVWAEAAGSVIGNEGSMPWHLPEDLAHFKQVTLGNPVIMGRRTWDSLPPRFRPLPGRRNIVVTRQADWRSDGVETAHSVDAALALAGTADAWVIGGAEIFGMVMPRADVLEVTEIRAEVPGDTHAPSRAGWELVASEPAEGWLTSRTGLEYRFLRYRRP